MCTNIMIGSSFHQIRRSYITHSKILTPKKAVQKIKRDINKQKSNALYKHNRLYRIFLISYFFLVFLKFSLWPFHPIISFAVSILLHSLCPAWMLTWWQKRDVTYQQLLQPLLQELFALVVRRCSIAVQLCCVTEASP